ncbi:MAG: zf-HC2 domain-containing protein [Candidatus Aminicenantaceae bacterium]
MKCKKCKEDIVLLLYGELADKDKSEVMAHIKGCPECADEWESTKGVFALLDETKRESAPEADWERCWGAIQTDIDERSRGEKRKRTERERRLFMLPGWAYAVASVFVIFVLGVLIGRIWLTSDTQIAAAPGIQAAGSSEYIKQSLNEHFETLKPMLVSYANYSAEENGRETITLDKEIVRSLLIQNYLLKKLVIESDPSAGELLEDLDLVLREIKNMPSDDKWAPSQVKELIHEREILFKMDILETL